VKVNWDDDIPNYLESHKIPGVENQMFPQETTPHDAISASIY